MDLSGAAQVFYEASQLGPANYKLIYCGVEKQARSEQGLLLSELQLFTSLKLNPGDIIFVPGVSFKLFKEGRLTDSIKSISGWLRKQMENGVLIASVCSGSLILAESGILNGRKCTTHWKCIDYMKKSYPDVSVLTDRLYVEDRRIYSSAGMASGIDMALSILENLHGPILPAKIAREIVVYLRRNESDTQQTIYLDYKTHFNPAIHKVQDLIISHPRKNFSVAQLAVSGNVSIRSLTRMFKVATGHTVVEFRHAVKVELAKTLVHNPVFTVEKIASLCGFQNVRHFRRIWREHTGTSVVDYKKNPSFNRLN